MADFCYQCAEELGFPTTDLANISTKEDTTNNMFATVLCEGCGFTQVDHEGKCISPDCLRKHGEDEKQKTNELI